MLVGLRLVGRAYFEKTLEREWVPSKRPHIFRNRAALVRGSHIVSCAGA